MIDLSIIGTAIISIWAAGCVAVIVFCFWPRGKTAKGMLTVSREILPDKCPECGSHNIECTLVNTVTFLSCLCHHCQAEWELP